MSRRRQLTTTPPSRKERMRVHHQKSSTFYGPVVSVSISPLVAAHFLSTSLCKSLPDHESFCGVSKRPRPTSSFRPFFDFEPEQSSSTIHRVFPYSDSRMLAAEGRAKQVKNSAYLKLSFIPLSLLTIQPPTPHNILKSLVYALQLFITSLLTSPT